LFKPEVSNVCSLRIYQACPATKQSTYHYLNGGLCGRTGFIAIVFWQLTCSAFARSIARLVL